ncbi:hypothetical protein [African swine fever virus]|uniref:Uncharacterized protein n=1 Tax=African swine fever virus TaxID=10497 RepID=A0A7T0LY29_ASF|nr:hypothetical protein [African swine fever virus]QPL12127.1 hypothetical protein [African swine fever virus]
MIHVAPKNPKKNIKFWRVRFFIREKGVEPSLRTWSTTIKS